MSVTQATPIALTIVIVNWNTAALLGDCLATIARETTRLAHEIIVVDNASTDGSAGMMRDAFPYVRLLEAPSNVGYAAGNNLALSRARGRYVALLNPDTLVHERALERLVDALEAMPLAGAVGPALRHPQGRYAVRNGGWQPTIGTIAAHYSGLSRSGSRYLRGLHLMDDRRQRVGWLSGACLVVRREVVAAVGPLHEEWFLYAEDVEWCDRIARAGWELWYEPSATIIHLDRQSTGQRGATFSTLWARGLHEHYRRRTGAGAVRLFVFDCTLAAGIFSRALLYFARALSPRQRALWLTEAYSFARAAQMLLRLPRSAR
jgi:GT2 family glycosyltransferase